jgi:hypothetical protein
MGESTMAETLPDLIEKIHDEQSFLRFFRALREDYEATERNCHNPHGHICVAEGHWESRSIRDFLRSSEDWGTRGDFGEGVHHGEPILRRIATMLYVGRYKLREEPPPDED